MRRRSSGLRRVAALLALVAYAAAIVAIGVVLYRDFWALVGAWLVGVLAAAAGWFVITRRGVVRIVAGAVTVAALVGVAAILIADHTVLGLVVVVGLGALATALATLALATHQGNSAASPRRGDGSELRRPVLLMNPKSGGGKAEKFHLEREARNRGIEPIVLRRDDDLQALARDAAARGADCLGMAGGDGSQALVAEVAMEHDVPFVCVPAGTRNHLALDLGVDRDDVVGALDAFAHGFERRIDLARVNDRIFVNNVSLGVYAKIVQSDAYRDDKVGTVAMMLPELLGPDCEPFDLEFDGPAGTRHESADLILVSNNPYRLDRIGGFGSRPTLGGGALGVVVVEVRSAAEVAELVTFQTAGSVSRFRGWREWAAPAFEVRSREPIAAGVDGEALVFESPVRFEIMAGALRVRIAPDHPGQSPAAAKPAFHHTTLVRLARLAFAGEGG